ncbi:MAG: zf-HC2 domain-containing protein [Candidatus Nitrospinota bacterium M3_3B_026]
MSCVEFRELLWDFSSGALPGDEARRVEEHVSGCPSCAGELEFVGEMRSNLAVSPGAEAREGAHRALARARARIEEDERRAAGAWAFSGFPVFKPLVGAFAAAAVLALAIIAVWPGRTAAVGLDAMISQHLVCIIKGHHANYECDTEAEFVEMALAEIGAAPVPFSAVPGSFIKGDMCRIDSTNAAHALFDADGDIVSYFQFKDASGGLMKGEAVKKIGAGAWRYSSRGHEMIIVKEDGGVYSVYTSRMAFPELLGFVESARRPAPRT